MSRGMGERLPDRALGDLVEGDAVGLRRGDVGRLGHVPGDRLALAVEVGGELARRRPILTAFVDRGDLLAAVLRDHVLGREVVVDVDPELALARVLGQVADMAVGGEDRVVRRRGSVRSSAPWPATRRSRGSWTRPGV